MASPFRVFRKHQKAMLAVVAILAMFAFVFIGPWSQLGETNGASRNPEVFQWKFGTVHEHELQQRRALRDMVVRFLYNARVRAGVPPQQVESDLNRFLPRSEQAVVDSMLLAKKAEQLGIYVSDSAINVFIRGWTMDRVRKQDLSQAIANLRSESRISQAQLFEALRFELSAFYARYMFSSLFDRPVDRYAAFGGDTPADRWEYFCRLNRKLTAQILPVPVESFVGEIADPSPDLLRGFYEQYKNDFPSPGSPTPGFRRPFKAQFQYVKADYDKFVNEQLASVTDDEVKEHYEKYKDVLYRKVEVPEAEAPPADAAAPTDDAAKESADAKSGETKSEAGDAKSNGGKSPEKSPEKSSPDGKQSALPASASLDGELLALADEAQAPATAPASDAPAEQPGAQPAAEQPPAAATTPPVEYKPLEEVSDGIRHEIAASKASKKIGEAFAALRTRMDSYRNKFARYRSDLSSGLTSAVKPEMPDLAALAEQYGLEYKQTEMLDQRQAVQDADIAKSRRPLMQGAYTSARFVDVAYQQPNHPLFQPDESVDVTGSRYLWWKIADEPSNTPPLEKIEPEVVMAWKIIEARKPALAKAEQYAADARRTGQPLKELFGTLPNAEIVTAGPFSWMARRADGSDLELGEVKGVENPGIEFYKAVFALNVGQAGVAPNAPQTVYYVAQIEAEEPPVDKLREEYMAAMANPASAYWPAVVGAYEHAGEFRQWVEELKDQYDFRLAQDRPLSDSRADME